MRSGDIRCDGAFISGALHLLGLPSTFSPGAKTSDLTNRRAYNLFATAELKVNEMQQRVPRPPVIGEARHVVIDRRRCYGINFARVYSNNIYIYIYIRRREYRLAFPRNREECQLVRRSFNR